MNPDLTLVDFKHDRDGLVSWWEALETRGVTTDTKAGFGCPILSASYCEQDGVFTN
jgi:hypothetical protein